MIEMYKILTGKYDVDLTPKVLRVYDSTTRGNMFKLDKLGRAKYDFMRIEWSSRTLKYDLRKYYFTNMWLMLETISLTMLYYLKLLSLTLLNRDLINFGNIKIWFMTSKQNFTEPKDALYIAVRN